MVTSVVSSRPAILAAFSSATGPFNGIDDSCCQQVLVGFGTGVEAKVGLMHHALFALYMMLPSIPALSTMVRIGGTFRTISTPIFSSSLVQFQFIQHSAGTDIKPATGHDTFFHRSTGSMQGIIHTVFLFLRMATSEAAPT